MADRHEIKVHGWSSISQTNVDKEPPEWTVAFFSARCGGYTEMPVHADKIGDGLPVWLVEAFYGGRDIVFSVPADRGESLHVDDLQFVKEVRP